MLLNGMIAATLAAACTTTRKIDVSPSVKCEPGSLSKAEYSLPVNMPIVKKCFERFKEKIHPVMDGTIEHSWNDPKTTEKNEIGTYFDMAIYLNDVLSQYAVDSKLVAGTKEPLDTQHYMWLEIKSRDTTYILDPSEHEILYRNNAAKKIVGNIDDPLNKKYASCSHKDILTAQIMEYYRWNKKLLPLDNKLNDVMLSKFLQEFPDSHYALLHENENDNTDIDALLNISEYIGKMKYIPDHISHPEKIVIYQNPITCNNNINCDYWESPYETQRAMGADCDGFAIYFQDKADKMKVYSQIAIGILDRKTDVRDTITIYHAWNEAIIRDTVWIFNPGTSENYIAAILRREL